MIPTGLLWLSFFSMGLMLQEQYQTLLVILEHLAHVLATSSVPFFPPLSCLVFSLSCGWAKDNRVAVFDCNHSKSLSLGSSTAGSTVPPLQELSAHFLSVWRVHELSDKFALHAYCASTPVLLYRFVCCFYLLIVNSSQTAVKKRESLTHSKRAHSSEQAIEAVIWNKLYGKKKELSSRMNCVGLLCQVSFCTARLNLR